MLKAYDHIQAAFPGERSGAEVIVQAQDVRTPAVQAAIADLKREALASEQAVGPTETRISRDGTTAQITLPLVGDGSNAQSLNALAMLRDRVAPSTVGSVPGVAVEIGGAAAETKDANDNLASHAPIVFGFVLTVAFFLLLLTFRSIVIPIKAILLNLLSVAAAFGVLTLVFQDGLGESIGLMHTKGVVSWLPVFLFVIRFGLSMDYHVFILSRIKEGWDKGLGNSEAGEQGIRSSAGVVTAAATVMIAVFSIFADALARRPAGVRRRPRGRRRDRRHADPRRRPAGLDEAARHVELVHAAQPRLAPGAVPRGLRRPRRRERVATSRTPARPTARHLAGRRRSRRASPQQTIPSEIGYRWPMFSGLENPIHILIILVIVLLVVGPSQLPKLARSSGRRLRETKEAAASFKDEFERGVEDATPVTEVKPTLPVATTQPPAPAPAEPVAQPAEQDAKPDA